VGVQVSDTTTTGTTIQGNLIGTDAGGVAPLANGVAGVRITDAAGTTVGGVATGEANVIAGNAGAGVAISGASASGNQVRGNAMFGNAGLGIDLGNDGATANDPDDPDGGPNGLQNAPLIDAAHLELDGTFVITTTIDSLALNSAYPLQLDLYQADSTNAGQRLLATTLMSSPGSSVASLSPSSLINIISSDRIVATVTDANGNTSEFSPVALVTGYEAIMVTTAVDTIAADGGCSLREAISAANTGTTVNECVNDGRAR
jgi:CSLREA domain-containing protein